ncbi:MAG: recombinase family protein [Lachnospiraceae bacterium]|nr:recombinase family protein [Lachnospiraceae bacterium]
MFDMFEGKERFTPHNTIDNQSWSTAVYVRLSDEDRDKLSKEDMSRSLINQIANIKEYIDYQNSSRSDTCPMKIYKEYSDDDFTGMTFERKAFQEMMRDVKTGLVDCIIVKNLSRLGRYDTKMQNYMENEFEQSGKQVRFIAIGDHYDSLYQELDILTKMILIMNRKYSEDQHKNVLMGMHSMQKKGQYVGAFVPYGYRKDPEDKYHLVIDEYAADVVRDIFRQYLAGVSQKEIALDLTRRGIVNRAVYKKIQQSNYICSKKISDNEVHWTCDSVKQILMNEVYTGTLVQGKTVHKRLLDKHTTQMPKEDWIRVEGTHEAIVSKEDWEIAQSMMSNIRRDTTKPDEITIFKGILKCGDCRHAMRKKWDNYNAKCGKRHRYLYYNCGTFRDFSRNKSRLSEEEQKNMPSCTSHYISDKMIRKLVLDDLNVIIRQLQNLKETVRHIIQQKSTSKGASYEDNLQREIAMRKRGVENNQNRLKTARDKLLDGVLTDAEYKEAREDCESAIRCYENEISALKEKLAAPKAVLENEWVKLLLSKGQLEELDRDMVVRLIDKIYVYEDKHLEIMYKFSGEFDHLFVKEIKSI